LFLEANEYQKYLTSGQRYRLGIRAPLPADFQQICREAELLIPDGLEDEALFITDTRTLEIPGLNKLKLWSQSKSTDTC